MVRSTKSRPAASTGNLLERLKRKRRDGIPTEPALAWPIILIFLLSTSWYRLRQLSLYPDTIHNFPVVVDHPYGHPRPSRLNLRFAVVKRNLFRKLEKKQRQPALGRPTMVPMTSTLEPATGLSGSVGYSQAQHELQALSEKLQLSSPPVQKQAILYRSPSFPPNSPTSMEVTPVVSLLSKVLLRITE